MLLVRKLICDDGKVLYSRHRHDYQDYKDKNGKFYMLDGGNDWYYRTAGTGQVVEITTENNSWEEIREEYCRYNRHSESYVKLKDISDEWLQNIIDYYLDINHKGDYFRLYLEEKIYRAEKEIYVLESYDWEGRQVA